MAADGLERPVILLIEEPLESIQVALGEYRLVSASPLEEGLEKARALAPDLVLIAGFRPDLPEALVALDDFPTVVVTARADARQRVQLLRSGAADVISPDAEEELAIRIESLIGSRLTNRRLRRELGSVTARLAEANRELEALTYSVSHDLRAPLRAISGFSDVLLSDYAAVLAPEGARQLQRVCANASRLSGMLDDLLELSRLLREPMKQTRIDLTAMVRQLGEQLRSREPSRSVEVVVAEGLSVWADARLMGLLWEKLLDNAWKFTAPKESARIEVGHTGQAFFMRDNGVGYDMRYAQKLFTPFQRFHGSNFEGRGIGLAVAARVVTAHGGRIWAEAAVDSGATFFFTLAAEHDKVVLGAGGGRF